MLVCLLARRDSEVEKGKKAVWLHADNTGTTDTTCACTTELPLVVS